MKKDTGVKSYSYKDTSSIEYETDIGLPGSFPFTRGIYENMYRGRLWTFRQYAGFGSPGDTNKRFKELLSSGQSGLSIAFDLPTQLGLDSDNKLSMGEVGKVGVAIDTLEDMELLLKGIPMDKVSVSMTVNATAIIIFAMYIIIADKYGVDKKQLRGTIQNDILKEYIARGNYIYPICPSLRLTNDIVSYSQKELPHWKPISISGYHIREAGANASQELAFTFLNAVTYMEGLIKSGLKAEDFLPKLSFFFSVHNDFIEEVSKFRAARKIWARLLRKRFNVRDDKLCKLKFHAQTSGGTLTAQEYENNIVRVTIQALAAVLGGAQSLHTNARDEALALPSEDAVMLALRTQQIIAYESGVVNTVDPLGGSYAVEKATFDIEKKVNLIINRIIKDRGMKESIVNGLIQREIQESAYAYQKDIESGEKVIIGVNKYRPVKDPKIKLFTVKKKSEREKIAGLKEFKKKRDKDKIKTAFRKLEAAVTTKDNLVIPVMTAVNAGLTVGEISGVFENAYGRYKAN